MKTISIFPVVLIYYWLTVGATVAIDCRLGVTSQTWPFTNAVVNVDPLQLMTFGSFGTPTVNKVVRNTPYQSWSSNNYYPFVTGAGPNFNPDWPATKNVAIGLTRRFYASQIKQNVQILADKRYLLSFRYAPDQNVNPLRQGIAVISTGYVFGQAYCFNALIHQAYLYISSPTALSYLAFKSILFFESKSVSFTDVSLRKVIQDPTDGSNLIVRPERTTYKFTWATISQPQEILNQQLFLAGSFQSSVDRTPFDVIRNESWWGFGVTITRNYINLSAGSTEVLLIRSTNNRYGYVGMTIDNLVSEKIYLLNIVFCTTPNTLLQMQCFQVYWNDELILRYCPTTASKSVFPLEVVGITNSNTLIIQNMKKSSTSVTTFAFISLKRIVNEANQMMTINCEQSYQNISWITNSQTCSVWSRNYLKNGDFRRPWGTVSSIFRGSIPYWNVSSILLGYQAKLTGIQQENMAVQLQAEVGIYGRISQRLLNIDRKKKYLLGFTLVASSMELLQRQGLQVFLDSQRYLEYYPQSIAPQSFCINMDTVNENDELIFQSLFNNTAHGIVIVKPFLREVIDKGIKRRYVMQDFSQYYQNELYSTVSKTISLWNLNLLVNGDLLYVKGYVNTKQTSKTLSWENSNCLDRGYGELYNPAWTHIFVTQIQCAPKVLGALTQTIIGLLQTNQYILVFSVAINSKYEAINQGMIITWNKDQILEYYPTDRGVTNIAIRVQGARKATLTFRHLYVQQDYGLTIGNISLFQSQTKDLIRMKVYVPPTQLLSLIVDPAVSQTTSTTMQIPFVRSALPIWSVMAVFDDLWLFNYHQRAYGSTMLEIFKMIREIQSSKWNFLGVADVINNIQFLQPVLANLGSRTVYTLPSYQKIQGNGDTFFENALYFLLLTLPAMLVIANIMSSVGHLFKKIRWYRVAKLFPQFEISNFGLNTLDGNVQFFSFILFSTIQKLFQFSIGDKILQILNVLILFVMVVFLISFFILMIRFSEQSFKKARFEKTKITPFCGFFVTVDFALRNILLGMIHSLLRQHPKIQIFFLIGIEMMWIGLRIYLIRMKMYNGSLFPVWGCFISIVYLFLLCTLAIDIKMPGMLRPIETTQVTLFTSMMILLIISLMFEGLRFLLGIAISIHAMVTSAAKVPEEISEGQNLQNASKKDQIKENYDGQHQISPQGSQNSNTSAGSGPLEYVTLSLPVEAGKSSSLVGSRVVSPIVGKFGVRVPRKGSGKHKIKRSNKQKSENTMQVVNSMFD